MLSTSVFPSRLFFSPSVPSYGGTIVVGSLISVLIHFIKMQLVGPGV